MKITSAEAKKMIERLEDSKAKLQEMEQNNKVFNAAVGEDVEKLRPDYSFKDVQKEIDSLDREIMRVKHCLNEFNASTEVLNDLTIDQVLIRLPQLQARKRKYDIMRKYPAKRRAGITGSVIDYVYTNYIPEEADAEYRKVDEEITDLQLALDQINNTYSFEI